MFYQLLTLVKQIHRETATTAASTPQTRAASSSAEDDNPVLPPVDSRSFSEATSCHSRMVKEGGEVGSVLSLEG